MTFVESSKSNCFINHGRAVIVYRDDGAPNAEFVNAIDFRLLFMYSNLNHILEELLI